MKTENNFPVTDTSEPGQTAQMFRQDKSQEVFFEEEAMRLKDVFPNTQQDENHLFYLRHQLQCIKTLLTKLELPWDKYIPLLFRSFTFYMQRQEGSNIRNRNYYLSNELMECITYLSQSGKLINSTAAYYDKQIKDVEKKIAGLNTAKKEAPAEDS